MDKNKDSKFEDDIDDLEDLLEKKMQSKNKSEIEKGLEGLRDKKKSRFDDDDDIEDMKDKRKSRFDDDDEDDEPKEKKKEEFKKDDRKDEKSSDIKKDVAKKKAKDEDLDDEEDLFGPKIIVGIVVLAIIGFLLFKIFSGGGASEFTVSFNAGGNEAESSFIVKKDSTIMKPADPVREGYIFVGWYYNGQEFDFNTKITSDIELEARWVTEAEGRVSGVTLSMTDVTLVPGGSATLVATVSPATAINKSLKWSSSDETIATVDANGKVTALKAGKVTITVTTIDGDFKATAVVKVDAAAVPVTGVTLNRATMDLGVNETLTLTATVQPTGATNKGVRWSSSDTSIATVDGNGRVTGKKDGTVVITVKTNDGDFTATTTVVVKTIPLTKITLSNVSVTVGKTATMKITFAPTNASHKGVKWTSSDTNIATVNANGVVTGKAVGTATITATSTQDGKVVGTAKVTVTAPACPTYTYRVTAIELTPNFKLQFYSGTNTTNPITDGITIVSWGGGRLPSKFGSGATAYYQISGDQASLGGNITINYGGRDCPASKR